MTETVAQLRQRAAELFEHSNSKTVERINAMVETAWRLLLVKAPFALQLSELALRLSLQLDYRRGRIFALRNIGWCESATNLYQKAEQTLEESRRGFVNSSSPEDAGLVSTLNGLAVAQQLAGKHEAAQGNYLAALELSKKTKAKVQIAAVYNNLGTLYQRTANFSEVLECYYQALPITSNTGSPLSQARLWGSLGNVLRRVNETAAAIELLQQGLVFFRENHAFAHEGVVLVNLGAAHQSRSEYPEALNYYWQSLDIARRTGNLETEVEALHRIGTVYLELGETRPATAYFFKAVELARQLGSRFYESEILLQLGKAHLQLGDLAASRETLEQALELSEKLDLPEVCYQSHLALSEMYEKQGKLSAALNHYQAFHRFWKQTHSPEHWREIERLLRRKEFKNIHAALLRRKDTGESNSLGRSSDDARLSPRKLQRVTEFIKQNLAENISLPELAAAASLNQKYFLQFFKNSTGRTPHQFIVEQRVERAQTLLRTTHLSLAEIALRCGFSNQSHLTVQFRLLTATTPRKYRQRF